MSAARIALLCALAAACARPVFAQAVQAPTQPTQPASDATTLDTLQVTAVRPPTAQERLRRDLQRDWHPPRSAEQFGMDGGVPAWLGQRMVRGMTAAARAIPGWKRPIQPAIARAAPLDDEQMQRASRQGAVAPNSR